MAQEFALCYRRGALSRRFLFLVAVGSPHEFIFRANFHGSMVATVPYAASSQFS
jgi:hypothetical protein